MKYHRSVLGAKLYLGNNFVCSIATKLIQNSQEYIRQNEEKIKQDCEKKGICEAYRKDQEVFSKTSH